MQNVGADDLGDYGKADLFRHLHGARGILHDLFLRYRNAVSLEQLFRRDFVERRAGRAFERPLERRPRRRARCRYEIRNFLAERRVADQRLDRSHGPLETLHHREMWQGLAQALGEVREADRHRADVDHRLSGGRRHFVDDAEVAFAHLMRRLRQLGIDDDNVSIGIVDHDLDRLHVHRRIDHRSESGIEWIADDAAWPEHLPELVGSVLAEWLEVQACRRERIDQ